MIYKIKIGRRTQKSAADDPKILAGCFFNPQNVYFEVYIRLLTILEITLVNILEVIIDNMIENIVTISGKPTLANSISS